MARILFVDDDLLTLETLTRAVQLFGHQAIVAATGQEALTLAQDESPDLIFTDMQLPDMDGLALVRTLRSQPITGSIPTLMLSAHPHWEIAQAAETAGAQAYLSKPVQLKELLNIIQKYTEIQPSNTD